MFKTTKLKTKWCRWLKKPIQLALLATLSSGNTYAEGDNDALTIRITNNYEMIWDNAGSNSPLAASFWQPIPDEGYYLVGHYFKEGKSSPTTGSITVKDITGDTSALTIPTSFTKEWAATDSEGDFQDVSLWKPNCQIGYSFIGYIALNDTYYPSSYYTEPGRTNVQNIRCVNNIYLQETESEPELDELDVMSSNLISEDMPQDTIAMYLGQISDRFNAYKKITATYEVQQKGSLTATINNKEYPVQYASLTNSQNNTRFTSNSGGYEFPPFNATNIDEEYINVYLTLSKPIYGDTYKVSIPETKIKWSEYFNRNINNLYKVAYVAMSDAVFNSENISTSPFTIHFTLPENKPQGLPDELQDAPIYVLLDEGNNRFDIHIDSEMVAHEYNTEELYANLLYTIFNYSALIEHSEDIPDAKIHAISRILEENLTTKNLFVDLYLPHKNVRFLSTHKHFVKEINPFGDIVKACINAYKLYVACEITNRGFSGYVDEFDPDHFCNKPNDDIYIGDSLLGNVSNNSGTSRLIQTSLKKLARNYCFNKEEDEPPFERAWAYLRTYVKTGKIGKDSNTETEPKVCLIVEESDNSQSNESHTSLLNMIGNSKNDTLETIVKSLLNSDLNEHLSKPTKEYLERRIFDTSDLKGELRKILFVIFLQDTDSAITTLNYQAAVWGMNEASTDGNSAMVTFFKHLVEEEAKLQELYLHGRSFDFKGFWGARDLKKDITVTTINDGAIAESKGLLDKEMDSIFSDEIKRLAEAKAKLFSHKFNDFGFEHIQNSFNESRATLIETNEAKFTVVPTIYLSNVQSNHINTYTYNIKLKYHDDLPVKGALILNHADNTGIIKIDRQLSPIEKRAVLFEELGHLADVVTQGTKSQRFDMVGDEGRAFLFNTLADHFKSLAKGNGRIIPAIDGLVTPPGHVHTLGDDVLWGDIIKVTSKDPALISNDFETIVNIAKSKESEDLKLIEQNNQTYTVEVQSSLGKMVGFFKTLDTSGEIDDVINSEEMVNQTKEMDTIIAARNRILRQKVDVGQPVEDAATAIYNEAKSSYGIRFDIPVSANTLEKFFPSTILGSPYHATLYLQFTPLWSIYLDEISSDKAKKHPTRYAFSFRQQTIANKVYCTRLRGSAADDPSTGVLAFTATHTLETRYHLTSDLAWGEPATTSSTIGLSGTVSPLARVLPNWMQAIDISLGVGAQSSFKHGSSFKNEISTLLQVEYAIARIGITRAYFDERPLEAGAYALINALIIGFGGFAGVAADHLLDKDELDSNVFGGVAVNVLSVSPSSKFIPHIGAKFIIGGFNYNEDIVF